MNKTNTKLDTNSNGTATEEEKARQLIASKEKKKENEFIRRYKDLCNEFGMSLDWKMQTVIVKHNI